MTTIQIQDSIQPSRSRENTSNLGIAHGIYSMRTASQASFPLDRHRTRTASRNATDRRSYNGEDVEEDAGLRQESDFKQKQIFSGSKLFWSLSSACAVTLLTCSGCRTNQSVLFMATLEPLRSMSSPVLSRHRQITMTLSGFSPLSFGP